MDTGRDFSTLCDETAIAKLITSLDHTVRVWKMEWPSIIMGHYCKVCGHMRPNEKFSGKGHRNHICKECASISADERPLQNMDDDEKLKIRAPLYLIGKKIECWRCDSRMSVVALLAPNGRHRGQGGIGVGRHRGQVSTFDNKSEGGIILRK